MVSAEPMAPRRPVAAQAAVSAFFFVDGAALGGWITHLRDVELNIGVSHGIIGRALLASGLGALCSMPLSGTLIHRFGSKNVSLVTAALLLAIMPFLLVVNSLWAFAPVLFLVGLSNGQLDVAMNAHSVAVQTRTRKPIISSIHGWWSLGGFAGGAGAAIGARAGLSPAQHLASASVILAVIALIAVRHMLPSSADSQSDGPRFAWPKGILLALGIIVTLSFVSEGALWDWAAVYLRTVLKTNAEAASLGFGVFSFGMAAGRFVGDRFVDRFGSPAVLVGSGLLAVAGLALGLATSNPWIACAGFAAVGLGISNMVPIIFLAAGTQPGISAGVGLAAVTACGYTGFLAGPPTIGMIADKIGLAAALGLVAILCLTVAIWGPIVVRRHEAESM